MRRISAACALTLSVISVPSHASQECEAMYTTFLAIAQLREQGRSYKEQLVAVDHMKDWPEIDKKVWRLSAKKVYSYAPYADLTPRQIGNLERGNCELREH